MRLTKARSNFSLLFPKDSYRQLVVSFVFSSTDRGRVAFMNANLKKGPACENDCSEKP